MEARKKKGSRAAPKTSNSSSSTGRRVTRSATKAKNIEPEVIVIDDDDDDTTQGEVEETLDEIPRSEVTFLDCFLENLDACKRFGNFAQIGLFIFFINMLYLYRQDDEKALGDLYTTLFAIVGVIITFGIVFNVKVNTYRISDSFDEEDKATVTRPTFPEFGLIYALFLPLLIALIKDPKSLPIVVGCVTQMSGMSTVVKVVVASVTSFQLALGTTSAFPTYVFGAAVLHAFFFECIDQFGKNSLRGSEKQLFASGFIALNFLTNANSPVPLQILQKLSVSFAVGAVVCTPIYNYLTTCRKAEKPSILVDYMLSAFIIVLFFSIGTYASVRSLAPVLKVDPFTWLFDFISETNDRITIFQYWLGSSVLLVPLFFYIAPKLCPLDFRRKLWHFVIFGALCYPIIVEPHLVSLALIFLIGMFIFIEFQRSLRLKPFGDFLATIFEPFEDSKDKKGPLVLSYIFLVLGIATPLFLNGCDGRQSSIAGLVTLGLGDSAASLIGKRLGSHKWPESDKSYQGSVAFFMFTVAGFYGFQQFGQNDYSMEKIMVTSLIAAIVEGVTEMNDNLILPLMTYLSLELLQC